MSDPWVQAPDASISATKLARIAVSVLMKSPSGPIARRPRADADCLMTRGVLGDDLIGLMTHCASATRLRLSVVS